MSRLTSASAKYRAAANLRIERHTVDDPAVRGVYTAVSEFVSSVDERDRPAIWAKARNAAVALRWMLLTRPRGQHDGADDIGLAVGVLRSQAHFLEEQVDPALLVKLRSVVRAAAGLEAAGDQLGDQIVAAARAARGRVCVVASGSGATQRARQVLGHHLPDAVFLGPRQFLSGPVWNRAVVLGISSWFADELFTAPRCGELVLVHHGWLRDRRTLTGLFSTVGGLGMQLDLPAQTAAGTMAEPVKPPVETVDWSAVEPVGGKPQDSDPTDDVPAHLVVLAGGYGFYLDVDADTIRGLDPAGACGSWIRQLPASDLGAGSIVMLRKGVSEREALLPRVSAILGSEEADVRRWQELWKAALRRRLETGGLPGIRRALGMPRLTPAYAWYWAGRNCISPRQPAFGGLLSHLGIDDIEKCVHAARKLYSAHHKAGQQLVRELGASIDDAVVRKLETEDSVALSVGGGVSPLQITLFRVVGVSPETTTVPAAALRTALKLRGAEWLG
jgi:hypothetical protein